MRGGGGAVSASIRRRRAECLDRPPPAAPHRRSDGAPASPLRYSGPRARAARLSPARREQAGDGLSSLHVPRRDEGARDGDLACAALRNPRSVTAQHGSWGAVGAPMRRRTGRSLPDPCPAAPNRSGDGAPAPVHGGAGSRRAGRRWSRDAGRRGSRAGRRGSRCGLRAGVRAPAGPRHARAGVGHRLLAGKREHLDLRRLRVARPGRARRGVRQQAAPSRCRRCRRAVRRPSRSWSVRW